jgi:hypothetical protein
MVQERATTVTSCVRSGGGDRVVAAAILGSNPSGDERVSPLDTRLH